MLTLFTNITEDMTDLEKGTLVPMLLDTLRGSHDENRMKGKWICGWFKASGYDVSEVRLRKMVNFIRVTNAAAPAVLIGAGNGYFLTRDMKIVEEQIESLQGRVDAIAAAIDALKSQLLNLKKQ